MSRPVPILRSPNPFNFGYPQINGQFQRFPGVETPVLSYLPIPYANNPSSSPTPNPSSSPSPSPAQTPTPTPAQTPNSPATRNRKVSTKWDSDGVNGGKTSMDVLLTWLMEEGNYSRYKGGDGQKGEKKDTILSQIVALLHAEGLTHRDKGTVGAKITAIEGQFRKAMEWLANTGQGLQDDGDEASIKKYLNKICPYYEDLGEIMMDKPSIYANITSDNLESQPSRHLRSVSLSSCTSAEISTKRQRDGGLNEQLEKLASALMNQSNEEKEENKRSKLQKMEMFQKQEERENRRDVREEQKEKSERVLRRMKTMKLELELERERIRVKNEEVTLLAATLKKRKELLDVGCSKEEVDSVIPLPVTKNPVTFSCASTESIIDTVDNYLEGLEE
jgi:hypothetical protein